MTVTRLITGLAGCTWISLGGHLHDPVAMSVSVAAGLTLLGITGFLHLDRASRRFHGGEGDV